MRETALASKIYKELKTNHNCFVFNIAGSIYQKRGMPDCLIVKDGRHIWCEAKDNDEPVEPHQLRVHEELRQQGVHVHILRFLTPNCWLVDDLFQIQFIRFKDGCDQLLKLLIELEKSRKGDHVSMVASTDQSL